MAINLHTKYSKKIADRFRTGSFIAGNTSNDYEFDGVKSIKITTLKNTPVTNYVRNGLHRFGEIKEVEDFTQTLTMTQEPAWTASIDEGNASDQQYIKKAGKYMRQQNDEVTTPLADKYALKVYAKNAGQIVGITAPTKSTIVTQTRSSRLVWMNAGSMYQGVVPMVAAWRLPKRYEQHAGKN